ncbi:hypothetical protein [Acidovorax sp.]|uniref:hypothetical protein n=1 Tax=Acidovorax sp. TaxID=1872122 RepID=UPI00391F09BA
MRSTTRCAAALALGAMLAATAQAELTVRPASRDAARQWLESSLPSFFPPGAGQDGMAGPYAYRFYPSVGNAFAFSEGRFMVASQSHTAGQIVDLTAALCQANAALCENTTVLPPGTGTGAASDCFNPVLLQQGTTYRWDWQSADAAVQFSTEGRINGPASFAGQTGLIETERTVLVSKSGTTSFNARVLEYDKLETTPQGPVLLRYGSTARMDAPIAGMRTTMVLNPANRVRDFALALNESYTLNEVRQTTIEFPGLPAQTSTTRETQIITYRGQESVTVPAGTYMACKFEWTNGTRVSAGWTAKGTGLPLVITGDDGAGNPVTLYIKSSSHINGHPI